MPVRARNAVVVGIDVSEPASQAARWAVREADTRRRPLLVVHVFEVRSRTLASLRLPDGVTVDIPLREAARTRLAEVVAHCRALAPDVEVDGEFLEGDPVEVLAEVSADAALLVLGSSGAGAVARVLMGSTSAELVRKATAPVVVVRGEDSLPDRALDRIIVGVDESATSARAIAFAYDMASRHEAELVAVHAWHDHPLELFTPVRAWEIDWHLVKEHADTLLSEALAGERERYPDVPVHRVVSGERPAEALIDEIHGSSLIVVGSHGRGAVGRALLGSVSQAVLHYAPCPVAVLRARDR